MKFYVDEKQIGAKIVPVEDGLEIVSVYPTCSKCDRTGSFRKPGKRQPGTEATLRRSRVLQLETHARMFQVRSFGLHDAMVRGVYHACEVCGELRFYLADETII